MVAAPGWKDPLGQTVQLLGGPNGEEMGVVRDYHHGSLHEPIVPTILDASEGPLAARLKDTFLLRVHPENVSRAPWALEETWKRHVPDRPFTYPFLDEDIDALYRLEQRFIRTFAIFTMLAVVVASLGLFGLAAFTAGQRTKEIGIPKVLGAGVTSIVALLSREFLLLVVIAFVLAMPAAYLAMPRWLADFAYRIELSPGLFVMAGAAALFIALATVSYQSARAALADPVKSLPSRLPRPRPPARCACRSRTRPAGRWSLPQNPDASEYSGGLFILRGAAGRHGLGALNSRWRAAPCRP